ncbi:unnamed protein product [Miscanthus lutarioriparius]|uniref:DUF4283 domain-containing protein n=1 Tax=Miscanthus lutarioriparius TaxID=422564 RepID=A0A811N0R8_9POAL|nr:unnamed protein product [Miscanthus lutarioriparius]
MKGGNQLPLESPNQTVSQGVQVTPLDDNMVEMLGRLNLTSEESDAVEVADDIEEDLATSDCAIIGKILSQGVLHIQTITSALKPAWGNPKGLRMRTVGDNMFIADFGSKQDKNRVLDGSPWNIGKRNVLVQEFDASMRPSDIHFDYMSIWVRIYNIPFGLMNGKWGYVIAKKIGPVEKLEVDDQDRAWGAYLRAKVQINITKPLMRGVSIFSTKRQAKEWYEVRYEKLPNYCYSCGIIGYSSVECLTPAERDADGLLPYSGDLRVPDDRKKRPSDDVNGQSSTTAGKSGGTSGQESMSGAIDLRTLNNQVRSCFAVSSEGRSGGLALFWVKECVVSLEHYSMNIIDVLINLEDGSVWKSTFVYGEPKTKQRYQFWDLLRFIRAHWNGPWLCAEDFNEALSSDEHLGRTRRGESQMKLFRECLENCGLLDLGFSGPKFT